MADTLTLSFNGWPEVESKLKQIAQRWPEQFGAALMSEAEIEMTEAKNRTPVKTGTLKASGIVTGPTFVNGEISVKLSFGGAANGYAIFVHENMEAFHRIGQAKFLESVILESAPYLPQRVADRIQNGSGRDYAPTRLELKANRVAVAQLNEELG